MSNIIPSMVAVIDHFLSDEEAIQFRLNNKIYVIGEACTRHKLDWRRELSAFPDSQEWQGLFFGAIHISGLENVNIVSGCPANKLSSFKNLAPKSGDKFVLEYPRFETDKNYNIQEIVGLEQKTIKINNIEIVPESAGHGIRYATLSGRDIHVVSLGFGTTEIAQVVNGKVVSKTVASINKGARIAAETFRELLDSEGVTGDHANLSQLYYWDNLLRAAHDKKNELWLTFNTGERKSIFEMNKLSIIATKSYASALCPELSTHFRNVIDNHPIVLCGGSTFFTESTNFIKENLESLSFPVKIAPEEHRKTSAAKGYKYLCDRVFKDNCIGIDIGNNNTVLEV